MRLKQVLTALNNATVTDVAYKSYVAHTPIRSGNARRKTKKGVNQVVADYPYAQRLQDNASPQTLGKGIAQPTIDDVRAYVFRTTGVRIK
jgi:hypothetical protein